MIGPSAGLLTIQSVHIDDVELRILLHHKNYHMRGTTQHKRVSPNCLRLKKDYDSNNGTKHPQWISTYMNPAPPVMRIFFGV
jgi:hypothetical protein